MQEQKRVAREQAGEKNRERVDGEERTRGCKVTGNQGWIRWEFRVSSTPGVAAFNPSGCMREERVLRGLRLRIGRPYFGQCFF